MSQKKKVAILTAGGLAPCLSAAVGQLILHYTQQCPTWDIICYRSGYKGLLKGESIVVTSEIRAQAGVLRRYGGSVIGKKIEIVLRDDAGTDDFAHGLRFPACKTRLTPAL